MEFLLFSLIRAPHLERGLKPLDEFPAAGGPQTFSQGLQQYVFVDQEVAPQPFQPTVFFFELPKPVQLTHPQVRAPLLPAVESRVSHPSAGTGRRPGCPRRHVGWGTRSVPRRTSTASWVHSFRKGPPKLPSVFGETSFDPTFRMAILLVSLPTTDGLWRSRLFHSCLVRSDRKIDFAHGRAREGLTRG